jgi:hypothetical protein
LPNEMVFYVGLLPLLLLPFAFYSKQKMLRNCLLTIFFASMMLMLSDNLPLVGRVFHYLLGGLARVPVRASFMWSFSIALLSALGLQEIIEHEKDLRVIFSKICNIYFRIFTYLLVIALPALIALMLSSAGSVKMPFLYFPMVNSFSLFLVTLLIYTVIIWFVLKKPKNVGVIILLVAFFVIDLFSFHMANSFIFLGNSPGAVLGGAGMQEVDAIKKANSFYRVKGLDLKAYANGLFTLGYGSFYGGFTYRPAMELYSLIKDDSSPIYDLMGVKYFYSDKGKLDDFRSSVTASSFMSDHRPYDAFDGNEQYEWVVDLNTAKSNNDWIDVRFRKTEIISKIEFLGRDNGLDKEVKSILLLFSNGSVQNVTLPSGVGWKVISIRPIKSDSLRFIVKSFDTSRGVNDSYGFREIKIYNTSNRQIDIGSPKFEKLGESNLFINNNAFPRAFITHSYKSFGDRNEMFNAISADEIGDQMRNTAFLYKTPFNVGDKESEISADKSQATIIAYRLDSVLIKASAFDDGILVLSDIWFPGWNAYIDGKKTQVFSAYNALRAVKVQKGDHVVIFKYEPWSFRLGSSVTLITLFSVFFYFISSRGKKCLIK